MKLHQKLQELAAAVAAGGGRLYVVGGWVRDFRLGRPSSDVDCEVHRISSVQLLELLNEEGSVARVGRSFGVYKWSVAGECTDVHLVESSGSLQESVDGAIQRRDFCCNALLFDPLNEQILDRVGGLEDIEEKRLLSRESVSIWRGCPAGAARTALCRDAGVQPAGECSRTVPDSGSPRGSGRADLGRAAEAVDGPMGRPRMEPARRARAVGAVVPRDGGAPVLGE